MTAATPPGGLPFKRSRAIMEERFESVYELGCYYSERFAVTRLLQRFPERMDMEPPRDHTLNISMGGSFAVEKYHHGRLAGAVDRPNAVTVIQRGQETSWRAPRLVDVLHIYFDSGKLSEFVEREMEIPSSSVFINCALGRADPFLSQIARALFEEVCRATPKDYFLLDSFYHVLARHFVRTYTTALGAHPVCSKKPRIVVDRASVRKAKEYLLGNLSESLSLESVAAHVAMPSVRLRDMFKAETGHTPYQFVLVNRIARAQEILAAGDISLAEVAYACGFASQSHMTGVFRQKLGVTPGRYRKEVQG